MDHRDLEIAATLVSLAGEFRTKSPEFARRLADHLAKQDYPFIFSAGRDGFTLTRWHNPPPKTRELIRELRRLQNSRNPEVARICARAEGLLVHSPAPSST